MKHGLPLLCLVVCSSFVACKEEEPGTQVMAVIDAESDVRPRVFDVDVSVRSGEGDVSTWSSRFEASLTPGSAAVVWPLEVALIPRHGETQRNYLIVATARGESGGVLAEVRAISGYVEGRSLSLPLIFDSACLAREYLCEAPMTCRAGSCVDPYVEPATLLPFERGASVLDPMNGTSGGGSGGGSAGSGGSSGDDAAVSPDHDASVNDCADPTTECDPPPTVECSEEYCAGCPEGFARTDDDSCTPLLLGLGLSKGEIAPALNAYDVRYRIELPLLGDALTFTPVLPAGVQLELNGEPLPENTFTVQHVPLGTSTVLLTLNTSGQGSRTYTFTLSRTGAQRSFLKARNTDQDDRFGHALAQDGDTIVVSAPGEDSSTANYEAQNNLRQDSGAAYVLVRDGPSFRHEAYLKASAIERNAGFGTALALDGDTLAVGAPDEAAGGSVYVFTRSAGAWQQQQRLGVTNGNDVPRFGASVALHGDRLIIGAPADDTFTSDAGAAYVYERTGSSWTLVDTVGASTPQLAGWFGSGVAFQDDVLVVGATAEDTDAFASGAAYVLRRIGGKYEHVQRLTALEPGPADVFGDYIQIDGDTIAIGAFGASSIAMSTGAVYVYVRSGEEWVFQQRLGASNPSDQAHFGARLALRGDLLLTGAPDEDSGGHGIDGDLSAPGLNDSGAAYLFKRENDVWSQIALIKADHPEAGDRFGWSVHIDGDSFLISAPAESSIATGVDGDPLINGEEGSGAVYLLR